MSSSERTLTDPWSVLGIDPDASDVEVRAAWRAAVRRHHPDGQGHGDLYRFREAQQAYDTIIERRKWPRAHATNATSTTDPAGSSDASQLIDALFDSRPAAAGGIRIRMPWIPVLAAAGAVTSRVVLQTHVDVVVDLPGWVLMAAAALAALSTWRLTTGDRSRRAAVAAAVAPTVAAMSELVVLAAVPLLAALAAGVLLRHHRHQHQGANQR